MLYIPDMGKYTQSGFIASIVVFLVIIISRWIIFKKAGYSGWKSVIPIYNEYVSFKFIWGNGWLFLLMLIPIVNIVIVFINSWKLSKVFDHGVGYFLLLSFLPVIGYPLIAFGDNEYIGPNAGSDMDYEMAE